MKPLLSGEEIGTAYRTLAATLHPDQPGGDEVRFRELGEAAAILRDPARRLRVLTDLQPSSSIPPEAALLFPRVASLLADADELLARHSTTSNPLARAVLAAPRATLAPDLKDLLETLEAWRSELDARLVELDGSWPAHEPAAVVLLADSYAYLGKWQIQLRERSLSLACL